MVRRTQLRLIAAASIASVASCTFGGLGEYEIEECNPSVTAQSTDACDRLSASAETCTPFQCDPGTRTCVERTRDDDRDGDPSLACGGTDCDDGDALNAGIFTEACDGRDNTCDGVIDEGKLLPQAAQEIEKVDLPTAPELVITSGDAFDGRTVAAYVATVGGGSCIQVIDSVGGEPSPPCAFLLADLERVPRQPMARAVQGGAAAVFVDQDGCLNGALSYRRFPSATADLPCPALPAGAALPAVASFHASSGDDLMAWFAVDVRQREDPFDACQGAAAAPLRLAWVRVGGLQIIESEPLAGGDGVSVRPPSMLLLPSSPPAIAVAAPSGDDVGVWIVPAEPPASPRIGIPALAGARAVTLGARVGGDDVTHLALVAEIGCQPQGIAVAFGAMTADGTGAMFGDAVEIVAGGEGIASAPSIAWVQGRSEWLVTWVSAGPRVHGQRLSAEGARIGAPFELADASAAVATADGHVFAVLPGAGTDTFVEIPVGCP